jgi:hypothetical protein
MLAILGGVAPAVAQPSRPAPASVRALLQRLRSSSAAERKSALVELEGQRKAVIAELMRVVGNERTSRSGKPDTALHLAMLALGDWNATAARSLLMEMVDYRLDLDAGAKYPPGYEYPAAFALTRMSGTDNAEEVAARLGAEDSPVRRRLLLWTLYRTLGAGGAAEVVESAAKRAQGAQVERLRTAREDLKLGNQLVTRLQPPTR